MITVHRRLPKETVLEWIEDFVPRLETWFAENPNRKICKVTWLYGKSVDMKPDSYKVKIAKLLDHEGIKWPTPNEKLSKAERLEQR